MSLLSKSLDWKGSKRVIRHGGNNSVMIVIKVVTTLRFRVLRTSFSD